MNLPVVAIVGRPNVGKSSLLNSFAGERISIVDSTPGVTRDRVSALVPFRDVVMEMVDTGGIGIVDQDDVVDNVARHFPERVLQCHRGVVSRHDNHNLVIRQGHYFQYCGLSAPGRRGKHREASCPVRSGHQQDYPVTGRVQTP